MGRRFGFNCAYCSSRLEATEAMCAQEGVLPIDLLVAVCEKAGCVDQFDQLRA